MHLWMWFVLYAIGVFITGEVCLLEFWYDDKHKAPVISALVTAFLWPLFGAWYVWKSIKAFARHMLVELSELR